MIIERFAPSPTGLLHLGHALSALTAFDAAQAARGEFLLRIEDIDAPRATLAHEKQMLEDLTWLGLKWSHPVLRQSERLPQYTAAISKLAERKLVFPCSCTRKDIEQALSARQEGDTPFLVYPGTCRDRDMSDYRDGDAIRLNAARAVDLIGDLAFTEIGSGSEKTVTTRADDFVLKIGDVVLARKDIKTSYNISVVVDDAAQNVTHVTRGEDMLALTPIHVLLQKLLGLPTPVYRHHWLVRDQSGKRLAKRNDALALMTLRESGWTPMDVRAHLDALRPT